MGGHMRRAPILDYVAEERLISILSQISKQKLRLCNAKELSCMLRLTPLRETISGQELLKEDRVDMLARQIQRKFVLAPDLLNATIVDLNQLELDSLRTLIGEILFIDTLEQLEQWITDHLVAAHG